MPCPSDLSAEVSTKTEAFGEGGSWVNMKCNKLVRDRVPEIIEQKGGQPVVHVADDSEYWQKLKEKLQEELNEFSKGENIEEIADILEVIEAICEYRNFDQAQVRMIKDKKAAERGKFKDRIILEQT